MIQNQIIPAGNNSGKSDLLTGHSGVEQQKGDEKAEGGLFKFLMGSIQISEKNGEKNENSKGSLLTDRILGGNITEGGNSDDSSLKDILSGLEKNSGDELSTISELLENAMKSSVSEEEVSENGARIEENKKGHEESVSDSDLQADSQENAVVQKDEHSAEALSFYSEESEKPEQPDEHDGRELPESDADDLIAGERDGNGVEFLDEKEGNPPVVDMDPDGKTETDIDVDENGESVKNVGSGENKEPADKPQGADGFKAEVVSDAKAATNVSGEKIKTQGSDSEKSNTNSPRIATEMSGAAPAKRDSEFSTESVRPEQADRRDRDGGLINQLRTGIIAPDTITDREQNVDSRLNLDADENALIQKMFADLANGSIDQQAAEVRSIKANQIREIRYQNYRTGLAVRADMALDSGAQSSGTVTAAGTDPGKLSMVSVSGVMPESSQVSAEILDEDAANLWREHFAEYFESKEKGSAEQAAAMSRLGMESVTNISVRRNFAVSLGQSILTATGDGKKAAETWQKHTFTLENGKNIQLSAREIDGVLQLKLSSSSSELQKLLMDHQDEIRKHLEEEVNITIDLQLDSQNDGQMAGFFGENGRKEQSGSQMFDYKNGKTEEQPVEKVVPKAVRNFGYNQMEWSA